MNTLLILLGVGVVFLAWSIFRKERVGMWTFAPIWKANDYLKPPGPLLWALGFIIAFIGIILFFFT